jgi:hypothetical protein
MAGDLPTQWQPLDMFERLHGCQGFDLHLTGPHPAHFGAFGQLPFSSRF